MADTTTIADRVPPDAGATPPSPAPHPPPPGRRRGDRRGGGGQLAVAWFASRARNALRHPGRMGAVSAVVFAATLLTLILVPRQAQRAFAALNPRPDEWRDTATARAGLAAASAEVARARAELASARELALSPPAQARPPLVVLDPDQLRTRDSLQAVIAVLQRELARVDRSPLPSSYRQLAELPEMASEPRVRPLLDSLAAVEREREEFAALGGVDPIYVSLTTRVNAIGRSIQGLASRRAADAASALQALLPPPQPLEVAVERPPVDTLRPLERVAAAERAESEAVEQLAATRRVNAALAARAERARAGANFIAPPMAVLAAAVVVALVTGYLWVLIGELRNPLVADGDEVGRVTGLRTLAVIDPDEAMGVDRARRRADERAPDVLDMPTDAYRLLYLHLSPMGASLPAVAVTGSEPAIAVRVAVNLAAAAAAEARGVLLVDADPGAGRLAPALRVRQAPGLAEVLRGEASWPECIASVALGREEVVDVMPAGMGPAAGRIPSPGDEFRREMQRVARRYDLTVVAVPLEQACRGAGSMLPFPDVVLCAHAGVTRLQDLRAAVAALHGAGMRLHGVVLWDGDVREEAAAGRARLS